MPDNQTYLNLNKMCASAKKTAFGTIMNTFIGGLVGDTAYSGDLLSTAEVAFLDNMCKGSSRGGGLGTVFNELLTASKESKHITAITNAQANTFNKLCMSVTKASDTISETAYNGIGSILQWAGTKVDSMAIDVGNHILTFSLPDQVGTSIINHTAGTITAVCANTRTNLKATFTLSLDATATIGGVAQVSGVTENTFTSPVTYTITAEDGTPKEYVVTASLETYDLAKSTTEGVTLSVLRGGSEVDAGEDTLSWGDELTITATVADGYTLDSLTLNRKAFESGGTHTVIDNVSIVGIAVPSATGTPFEVDDSVSAIYFDTTVDTTAFNTYLGTLTYSDGICNLLTYFDGEFYNGILFCSTVDGVYYVVANPDGEEHIIVYDTTTSTWVGASVTIDPAQTANIISSEAGWNGEWVSKTEF